MRQRAIIYLRDGQVATTDQQRNRNLAYAATQGMSVVGEYLEDNPKSDALEDRPALQQAIETAKRDNATLLLDCVSRLSYHVLPAETLAKAIRKAKIDAVCTHNKLSISADGPTNVLSLQMLMAVTHYIYQMGPNETIL